MTQAALKDFKDPVSYFFLSALVKAMLAVFFTRIEIRGAASLPKDRPYICVSNHTSRWDGLVLGRVVDRPATFMVHPNELKGVQGALLRKVGAFPANPKSDFPQFVAERFRNNEPFVIFPEGNVFYDGQTHPFKKGFARVALAAAQNDLDVPVIPMAVGYHWRQRTIIISIGAPVSVLEYRSEFTQNPAEAMNALCTSVYREVLALRAELGFEADRKQLLSVPKAPHFLRSEPARV